MIYQLPSGKCVDIPVEQYLRMSDEELDQFVSMNWGQEVNDPFYGSVVRNGFLGSKYEEPEDHIVDEPYLELQDIPLEDKLYDADYIDEDIDL